MITYRCSSLPLYATCAAATVKVPPFVEYANDEAKDGTAVHAALKEGIAQGMTRASDVADMAASQAVIYDADPDEARKLTYRAWRAWDSLKRHFPNPEVEVFMDWTDPESSVRLTGNSDLVSDKGDVVGALDWKSGRNDVSPEQQLRGYALLALQRHPQAQRAYACAVRIRDDIVDGWEWTRAEIMAWWQELTAHLRRTDVFRVGRHCQYCPRALSCEARTQLMRSACESLNVFMDSSSMTPESLAALYDASGMVEKLAKQVRETIKSEVYARGRQLPLPDGRVLQIETMEKTKIDFGAGYQVLSDALGNPDALNRCCTISKTAAEKEVKAIAPDRQKSKLWKAVLENLEKANATYKVSEDRMECRRVPLKVTA